MKSFLVILVLLFLTSCFPYSRKFDLVEEKKAPIKAPMRQALSSEYFYLEKDWMQPQWWLLFEDDNLSQYMQMLTKDNPYLNSLRETTEMMHQEALKKRSKLLPNLAASLSFLWQHLSQNVQTATRSDSPLNNLYTAVGFSFDYEIDLWGKNYNTFKAAIGEWRSAYYLAKEGELALTTSLAYAYFDLQASYAKSDILREKKENLQKLLELDNWRFACNIDNYIKVNNAIEQIAAIDQDIFKLEQNINTANYQIQTLTGAGLDYLVCIPYNWKQPIKRFALPDNMEFNLLSQRPDLMARLYEVKSKAKQVCAAQAEFFPNLNLASLGGFTTLTINNLFSKKSLFGSLFPLFDLPVYTGGRLSANLKAKLADYKSSVYAYNNQILQACKEVADNITFFTTVNDRLSQQIEKVNAQVNNVVLEQDRFTSGLQSLDQVLNSQIALLDLYYEKVDLEFGCFSATLGIIKALGGGFLNE